MSGPSIALAHDRTRALAERFLQEMRQDVQRALAAGSAVLPRLRCVHERAGHATPEFRTLLIPAPTAGGELSPPLLSASIAGFAARCSPDRLLLVLDAVHQDGADRARPVLIAEARDQAGTRLFWMQPYRVDQGSVRWDDPLHGGWVDPGDEEMILDAAFQP